VATSGIRRKVDDLGRVVIPAQIRRALNIREGDAVEVTVEGERIVLARPRDACVFCGREDEDLLRFRNRLVCRDCVRGMGAIDERARTSLDAAWAAAAAPDPAPAPGGHDSVVAATVPRPTPVLHRPDPAVPPQVLERRGVLDGDAWAREQHRQREQDTQRGRVQAEPDRSAREDAPPSPGDASVDATEEASARDGSDTPTDDDVRPDHDPASTTAW
jgi:AbrB family transcriptional regulator, transcriptional pleiotropic regulator of transition state genes